MEKLIEDERRVLRVLSIGTSHTSIAYYYMGVAWQEKAASGNLQQLKQAVSMLETKVVGVDQERRSDFSPRLLQAVHDKVGAGQMQQLKSIVCLGRSSATNTTRYTDYDYN